MKVKLPNFSITKGQLPPDLRGGDRMRTLVRRLRGMGLWIGVGSLFFVLFAWLSLPTRAVAWRIGHEAKKAGYIVDVEDISVWPWGTVTLHNVVWTFEPSRPDTVPGKFVLEEVDVDVGLFALMFGGIDIDIEAEREEGTITGHFEQDDDALQVALKIEELPLYDVPKAQQALNVPLYGLFGLEFELEVPVEQKGDKRINKFTEAKGFVEMSCSECSLGDGETKLYVPGSKGLKDGVTIPEISLGSLSGRMEVEEGAGKIVEAIETESDDLKVSITGDIRFHDKVELSVLNIIIKADFSEKIQERSEKIRLMVQTASPKVKLAPPETGMGWRLEGVLKKPKFAGINSKSRRQRLEERRERQRARDARAAKRRADRERKKREAEKRANEKEDKEEPETDEPEQEEPDRDDRSEDEEPRDEEPADGSRLNIQPLNPPGSSGGDDGGDDDRPALPPPVDDGGNGGPDDQGNDPAGNGEPLPPDDGQQDGGDEPPPPVQ